MEIVKKNLLSIICGVIALIALIALYWPIGGMYDATSAELALRKKADSDLISLSNKKRNWPVIPELTTGAPTPLNRFPNEKVIEEGQGIKDRVSAQAQKMKETTVEENTHTQLVPDVLPNPKDDGRFRFQQVYMKTVQTALPAELQGTVPPTEAEIKAAGSKLYDVEFKPKILHVLGKDVNADQVEADWNKACAGLEVKMNVERAKKGKVYLDQDWLTIEREMPKNESGPREADIWYAQNMLWVQQDIVDALARINGQAHDVTDAPVKHISHLDVPDDFGQYVIGEQTGGNSDSNTTTTPTLGKAYGVTSTGRVCNPLYDVVRFDLTMIIDKNYLPDILAGLQKGKLITVKKLDLSSVDAIAAAESGFVYGDVPVVKVSIEGEELFLRDWTTPLMPTDIKNKLGIAPANGAANGK